jgi:hypothetical protein
VDHEFPKGVQYLSFVIQTSEDAPFDGNPEEGLADIMLYRLRKYGELKYASFCMNPWLKDTQSWVCNPRHKHNIIISVEPSQQRVIYEDLQLEEWINTYEPEE